MSLADTLFGKGKGSSFLTQDLGSALGVKPLVIEAPKIVAPKKPKSDKKTSSGAGSTSKAVAPAPALKPSVAKALAAREALLGALGVAKRRKVGEDTAIPIQIPLPTQQEGSQAADEEEEQGQNSDEARNESGEGSGSDDERSYDEEDAESDESDHSLEGEPQESPLDIEKREIFVGNVAVNTSKKQITSHFKKYGKIESIRFRSVAFVEPGGPGKQKREWIKKAFHPERDSMNAYIRFEDSDSAKKARAANATVLNGKHLRVDLVVNGAKTDNRNCIFVGNLPLGTEDEDLWEIFSQSSGHIDYVRVVRDKEYRVSKGFAYVKFKTAVAMKNAVDLNDKINYKGRVLRITAAITDHQKLAHLKNKIAFRKRKRKEGSADKFKKYKNNNSKKRNL